MSFQVRNLCTEKGGKKIHKNLNWEIKQGEYWVLAGKSGCGKTSLARVMVGLDRPLSGQLLWNGIECGDPSSIWGMQPQSNALFRDCTVMENVIFPLKYDRILYKEKFLEEVALFYLSRLGLDPALLDVYPNELSGGQKKFVALARALAKNPKMLLLDEPTAGLDPAAAIKYDQVLQQVAKQMGVVVITHDLQRIREASNVAFMEEGKLTICEPQRVTIGMWDKAFCEKGVTR